MNAQELQQFYARQAQIKRAQREREKYESLYFTYSVIVLCPNQYVEDDYICDYFE